MSAEEANALRRFQNGFTTGSSTFPESSEDHLLADIASLASTFDSLSHEQRDVVEWISRSRRYFHEAVLASFPDDPFLEMWLRLDGIPGALQLAQNSRPSTTYDSASHTQELVPSEIFVSSARTFLATMSGFSYQLEQEHDRLMQMIREHEDEVASTSSSGSAHTRAIAIALVAGFHEVAVQICSDFALFTSDLPHWMEPKLCAVSAALERVFEARKYEDSIASKPEERVLLKSGDPYAAAIVYLLKADFWSIFEKNLMQPHELIALAAFRLDDDDFEAMIVEMARKEKGLGRLKFVGLGRHVDSLKVIYENAVDEDSKQFSVFLLRAIHALGPTDQEESARTLEHYRRSDPLTSVRFGHHAHYSRTVDDEHGGISRENTNASLSESRNDGSAAVFKLGLSKSAGNLLVSAAAAAAAATESDPLREVEERVLKEGTDSNPSTPQDEKLKTVVGGQQSKPVPVEETAMVESAATTVLERIIDTTQGLERMDEEEERNQRRRKVSTISLDTMTKPRPPQHAVLVCKASDDDVMTMEPHFDDDAKMGSPSSSSSSSSPSPSLSSTTTTTTDAVSESGRKSTTKKQRSRRGSQHRQSHRKQHHHPEPKVAHRSSAKRISSRLTTADSEDKASIVTNAAAANTTATTGGGGGHLGAGRSLVSGSLPVNIVQPNSGAYPRHTHTRIKHGLGNEDENDDDDDDDDDENRTTTTIDETDLDKKDNTRSSRSITTSGSSKATPPVASPQHSLLPDKKSTPEPQLGRLIDEEPELLKAHADEHLASNWSSELPKDAILLDNKKPKVKRSGLLPPTGNTPLESDLIERGEAEREQITIVEIPVPNEPSAKEDESKKEEKQEERERSEPAVGSWIRSQGYFSGGNFGRRGSTEKAKAHVERRPTTVLHLVPDAIRDRIERKKIAPGGANDTTSSEAVLVGGGMNEGTVEERRRTAKAELFGETSDDEKMVVTAATTTGGVVGAAPIVVPHVSGSPQVSFMDAPPERLLKRQTRPLPLDPSGPPPLSEILAKETSRLVLWTAPATSPLANTATQHRFQLSPDRQVYVDRKLTVVASSAAQTRSLQFYLPETKRKAEWKRIQLLQLFPRSLSQEIFGVEAKNIDFYTAELTEMMRKYAEWTVHANKHLDRLNPEHDRLAIRRQLPASSNAGNARHLLFIPKYCVSCSFCGDTRWAAVSRERERAEKKAKRAAGNKSITTFDGRRSSPQHHQHHHHQGLARRTPSTDGDDADEDVEDEGEDEDEEYFDSKSRPQTANGSLEDRATVSTLILGQPSIERPPSVLQTIELFSNASAKYQQLDSLNVSAIDAKKIDEALVDSLKPGRFVHLNQPPRLAPKAYYKHLLQTRELESRSMACTKCGKPMPRCSVCRRHMGTPLDDEDDDDDDVEVVVEEKEAGNGQGGVPSLGRRWRLSWTYCARCQHGGHAQHVADFLSLHAGRCAVAACSCRCMDFAPSAAEQQRWRQDFERRLDRLSQRRGRDEEEEEEEEEDGHDDDGNDAENGYGVWRT